MLNSSVDPKTQIIKKVIRVETQNIGGTTTFDEKNKLFWFQIFGQAGFELMCVDVRNGAIVNVINNTNYEIVTLDWDPVTGYLYGIGLSTQGDRTLVRVDPTKPKVDTLGMNILVGNSNSVSCLS